MRLEDTFDGQVSSEKSASDNVIAYLGNSSSINLRADAIFGCSTHFMSILKRRSY